MTVAPNMPPAESQARYQELKNLAKRAGKGETERSETLGQIAAFLVAELRRLGISDGALCAWDPSIGFEDYYAELDEFLRRGPLHGLFENAFHLTRFAGVRLPRYVEFRSPTWIQGCSEFMIALLVEISRSTAEFRQRFGKRQSVIFKLIGDEEIGKSCRIIRFVELCLARPDCEVAMKYIEPFYEFRIESCGDSKGTHRSGATARTTSMDVIERAISRLRGELKARARGAGDEEVIGRYWPKTEAPRSNRSSSSSQKKASKPVRGQDSGTVGNRSYFDTFDDGQSVWTAPSNWRREEK